MSTFSSPTDASAGRTLNVSTTAGATPPTAAPQNGRWGAQDTPNVYVCPSAPSRNTSIFALQIQTAGFPGQNFPSALATNNRYTYNTRPPVGIIGITNYLPSAGYMPPQSGGVYFEDYFGLYYWKSKIKMANITDGTSNTIAFLESAGGQITLGGVTGWANSTWAAGICYANFGTCPDGTNGNCVSGSGMGLSYNLPGSLHAANRIMVAYADGTVRNIPPNLNFTLYVYLCGYKDNQIVSPE
jgi:hypothetical protein